MRKKRSSKNKKFVLIVIPIIIVGILLALPIQNNQNSPTSKLQGPWNDIHGVGMFLSGNDDTLYLATHQGLFEKKDSGWQHVGNDNADLMGFSMNHDTEKMYSSGHPKTGGNLGFRMSDDKGNSWTTISKVKNTPVDFHAMTASQAQNGLIYGSPGGGSELFVTSDDGTSWNSLDIPNKIISLAADPLDPNRVYAGTMSGLYVSNNQGKQWTAVDSDIEKGVITGIGFSSDGKTMYVFSTLDGNGMIVKSIDGGKTMVKTQSQIADAKGVWNFAPGRDGEIYAIAAQQVASGLAMSVYKTDDGGATWVLEGTNNSELALTDES
ncbi:glycosyl hydrolase BNR repeat-containing glycosyl hydrolase [Nitrosopumilus maritimus]|uniref:Glycosyl hydrolase BNR repeat-containing protein n=1 Tax=Nitrosopumilus maritimus (strain SCM1) TaxID=436308 RepID=A9A1P1_NITMS|nr:glycosyl hydrolase BNR repeat-containing glycosyl hydrolase [Nitrosopumilus maritimus]ABX13556.1 glycosyl hydrolase BNR repeat-containing protein [Nitrosopumilus maritimus SCM1]